MGMAKQQTPAKRENVAYSHLYVAYNIHLLMLSQFGRAFRYFVKSNERPGKHCMVHCSFSHIFGRP